LSQKIPAEAFFPPNTGSAVHTCVALNLRIFLHQDGKSKSFQTLVVAAVGINSKLLKQTTVSIGELFRFVIVFVASW
jgi:hypothetical protein